MKRDNTQSLSHTSYRCKYHIVIVPKYRRMVIYNRLRRDIIEILKTLIQRKPDVRIIEGEACPDHIHDNGNLKITKTDRLKITNYGEKTEL